MDSQKSTLKETRIEIIYCVECNLGSEARRLATAIKNRFGLEAILEEGHDGIFEIRIDNHVMYNNLAQGGQLPTDEEILQEIQRRMEPPSSIKRQSLKVMNPMGYPPAVTQIEMAPRIDTLEGKTVYLVDCRFDDGDLLMAQMQAWFEKHMPSVKTVLRSKSGVYTEDDPELFEEIAEKGDALVLGVGH